MHAGLHIHESGAGRPVVLLHAFPVDGRLYAGLFGALDVHLIVPDLPGFGRSPERKIATLDDYARAVLEVMDALGVERTAIGGTSMGGYVTFALLRMAPQRFDAVVLADTKMGTDTEQALKAREDNARKAETEGVSSMLRPMLPGLVHKPQSVAQVEMMARDARPGAVAAALRAMAVRPDSSDTAAAISVPTLVICGRHDALSALAEHEAMTDAIKGSRLVVVPGAGHLAALDAPGAFRDALADFLC